MAGKKPTGEKRNARFNALLIAVLLLVVGFAGFLAYIRNSNDGRGLRGGPDHASAAAPTAADGQPKYDFYQDIQPTTDTATAAAAAATQPSSDTATAPAAPELPPITLISPNTTAAAPANAPAPPNAIETGVYGSGWCV